MTFWKGLNEVGVRGLGRGDDMGRITNIKAIGKCRMETYCCRSLLNTYTNT